MILTCGNEKLDFCPIYDASFWLLPLHQFKKITKRARHMNLFASKPNFDIFFNGRFSKKREKLGRFGYPFVRTLQRGDTFWGDVIHSIRYRTCQGVRVRSELFVVIPFWS